MNKTLRLVREINLLEGGLKEVQALVTNIIGAKQETLEREIQLNLSSDYPLINEVGRYISMSKGKRLRPLLLFLSSNLCGYEGNLDVYYGTVIEYLHMATLVHDDILDSSLLRRGRPSVYARWGPDIAVLMGDLVFTRAMQMAIEKANIRILTLMAEVTLKLIKGELCQLDRKWDLTITEEEHLEIIQNKTACLFSASSKIGGLIADIGDEQVTAVADYGMNLGMSFQLVDDCLDFASDEHTLGKPVISDLKEGKVTLPLILLMQEATPEERRFIESAIEEKTFDDATKRHIATIVTNHGILKRVESIALSYAEKAKKSLMKFPKTQSHSVLSKLPGLMVSRRF